jgi:hypothetical protein
MSQKGWTVITWELRVFFLDVRNLVFFPLAVLAVLLSLWPYIGSPFVMVFLAVFVGMERQFTNIFFRSPREFEAMLLLPLDWREVVLAKNLATMLLALVVTILISLVVLYFSPAIPSWEEVGLAAVYFLTVLFPMIHLGNLRSLQFPRRGTHWDYDDLAGAVMMVIRLVMLSVPYGVFGGLIGSTALCIIYAVVVALLWQVFLVPRIAQHVLQQKASICLAK